jgi:O-succinylbenzoate synthase
VDRPDLDDVLNGARFFTVPLRMRFRGVDAREGVLIRGPLGWGEFAPFPEYPDDEAACWLAGAVEAAWWGWPAALRHEVGVNATVPAVEPARVAEVLARFPGCRTVKVKVGEPGQSPADDLARLRQVREVAGADARLRVDANGAWTADQAHRALAAFADVGLDYAEQPCATVADLLLLRESLRAAGIGVRLAADESIRRAGDPLAVARTGAIDVAVVKVAPLGGVRATLAVADALAALDVSVVVSSALDTWVGITAGLAAAAALPTAPPDCGLGTVGLLAADLVTEPLVPHRGRLPVRTVLPDESLLQRFSMDAQRRRWWTARLARCWRPALARLGVKGGTQ